MPTFVTCINRKSYIAIDGSVLGDKIPFSEKQEEEIVLADFVTVRLLGHSCNPMKCFLPPPGLLLPNYCLLSPKFPCSGSLCSPVSGENLRRC